MIGAEYNYFFIGLNGKSLKCVDQLIVKKDVLVILIR
jgi:hypothetical protein